MAEQADNSAARKNINGRPGIFFITISTLIKLISRRTAPNRFDGAHA